MANRRYGSTSAGGATNPIKVSCPHCGTSQYLKVGRDPWVCVACGKTN
jgi:ribosomal protein L37AE/L43A